MLAVAISAFGVTSIAAARKTDAPVEVHQRIAAVKTTTPNQPNAQPSAALTLDACGGQYDAELIRLLVANHIPATIFTTKKWLEQNPVGVAELLARPDLFEIEDHGAAHIPAVIGAGRRVYGILGEPDIAHLQLEVEGGAMSIAALTGHKPRYYRGATAEYDEAALTEIKRMGYQVAGFSVNADAGATLSRRAVAGRLNDIKNGDIIIAHMNKPAGFTAKGIADALPKLMARGFKFVTLSQVEIRNTN